jgi:hypothetical protein
VEYLAAKRAMGKGFLKASVTGSTIVSGPFELPVLRSLLDKHHFSTIYSIGLQAMLIN